MWNTNKREKKDEKRKEKEEKKENGWGEERKLKETGCTKGLDARWKIDEDDVPN